mgnify:CR=1 FL=1
MDGESTKEEDDVALANKHVKIMSTANFTMED